MKVILAVLMLLSCTDHIKKIERQKIVEIGPCDRIAYCVVRTNTGLVSYMHYPMVGLEVCEFNDFADKLIKCRDIK